VALVLRFTEGVVLFFAVYGRSGLSGSCFYGLQVELIMDCALVVHRGNGLCFCNLQSET
jgi:hypothetical protein